MRCTTSIVLPSLIFGALSMIAMSKVPKGPKGPGA
jgi:hypothetical protein